MARILGVNIPDEKKLPIALTYIYGIGHATASKILDATGLDNSKKVEDLSQKELAGIIDYIEQNLTVEGALKQQIFMNVKRLKDIKAYRGNRHKVGLPVRGQNTRKNASTAKGGKSSAVANKKKETK